MNELSKLTQAFIYFEIINEKKKIKGLVYKDSSKNWSYDTAKKNMEQSQKLGNVCIGVARVIKLQGSGIVCVDIDEKDKTYDEVIRSYPCLENQCYVKGNTKGFHFYVRSNTIPKCDIN